MIDLRTGTYYSLDPVGAEVWRAIEAGAAVAAIVDSLVSRYGVPSGDVDRDVGRLLDDLLEDDLIVAAEEPGVGVPTVTSNGDAPDVYAPPSLERFTDMQDLILLDPVHEVDPSAGWPHLPAEGADGRGP